MISIVLSSAGGNLVYKEGFVTVRLFMMSEIPLKMKECVRLTILRLDF